MTMLDPKITKDVADAWNAAQEDSRKGFAVQRALPTNGVMQQLIDDLFMTTLRVEEGHYPRFSIAWIPRNPTVVGGPACMTNVRRLVGVESLSAARLAKFCGAFDPDFSAIAVDWDEEKDSIVIWGIVVHVPPVHPLDEPLGHVESVQFGAPDVLRIMSGGPAALRFIRGNFLLGTLQYGIFQPSLPTPFTPMALGGIVTKLLNLDIPKEGLLHANVVLAAFQQLLYQMAIRGHGGTLVIVPGSKKSESLPLTSRNSFVAGDFGIRLCHSRLRPVRSEPPFLSSARSGAVQRLQSDIVHQRSQAQLWRTCTAPPKPRPRPTPANRSLEHALPNQRLLPPVFRIKTARPEAPGRSC